MLLKGHLKLPKYRHLSGNESSSKRHYEKTLLGPGWTRFVDVYVLCTSLDFEPPWLP